MAEYNVNLFRNRLNFIFAIIFFPVMIFILSEIIFQNKVLSVSLAFLILIIIPILGYATTQKILVKDSGLQIASKLKNTFVVWEDIVAMSCLPSTPNASYYIKTNLQTLRVWIPMQFLDFEEQIVSHAHLTLVEASKGTASLNTFMAIVPNMPKIKNWIRS